MSVTKTGASSNTKTTSNTDTVATGAPTGASAGDFGIISALLYGGTEGFATPSGWTALYSNVGFGTGGAGGRVCVFYKASISSGEASGGVTLSTNSISGTRWATVHMITTSPASLHDNSRNQFETGTSDNCTTTVVDVGANDLVVFAIHAMTQSGDVAAPGGVTEDFDTASPLISTIRSELSHAAPGANATYSKTFTFSQFGGGISRSGEAVAIVLTPNVATSYTVINGTESSATAGGTSVAALSFKTGVPMLATEVTTLLGTAGIAVMKDGASEALRRTLQKAYGRRSS